MRFAVNLTFILLIFIVGCGEADRSRESSSLVWKRMLVLEERMSEKDVVRIMNSLGFYESVVYFDNIGPYVDPFCGVVVVNFDYIWVPREKDSDMEIGIKLPQCSAANRDSYYEAIAYFGYKEEKEFDVYEAKLFILPESDNDCGVAVEFICEEGGDFLNRYTIVDRRIFYRDKWQCLHLLRDVLQEGNKIFPDDLVEINPFVQAMSFPALAE